MIPLTNKDEAQDRAKRIGLPAGPLSYTQINTWLMCHRAYWHNYVNRTPWDGWKENLVLGAAMHSGLEFVNRQKMGGSKIILDGALRAMDTTLASELSSSKWKVSDGDKRKLDKQLEMMGRLLELWVNNSLPGFRPTGVEETRYVLLGGIPMTIKIDLIDDDRKVCDFKLTGSFKNEKSVKNSLQLSIYAASTKIMRASYISFRFPKLEMKKAWKPEIEEIVVNKNPGDLEWAEEVVASVSKGILLEDWSLCDPGDWKCSKEFCDVWSKCRGRTFEATTKPKWMKKMLRTQGSL